MYFTQPMANNVVAAIHMMHVRQMGYIGMQLHCLNPSKNASTNCLYLQRQSYAVTSAVTDVLTIRKHGLRPSSR